MSHYHDPNDNLGSNPNPLEPLEQLIQTRLSRRSWVKQVLTGAAVLSTPTWLNSASAATAEAPATAAKSSLGFKEIAHGVSDKAQLAEGYQAQVLIRWGDPLAKGVGEFDPLKLTADEQEQRFGYNNDYVAYLPLDGSAEHGLLCVNHEYTDTHLMFPGLKAEALKDSVTAEQTQIEMAAHGVSVVEIKRDNGQWRYVPDSRYNRRISLRSSACQISGPAAGHARLQTAADSSGRKVIGTLNNCSGGKTPWGTILTAEENFHQYFSGDASKTAEARNHKRYGIKNEPVYPWWGKYVERFDVEKHPNEANRFGWMVEVNPNEPQSPPVKRTALGRFKHESAALLVNGDGYVVAYMGDDERFEYIYRFVSAAKFDPSKGAANGALLDEGTLYVAKFSTDSLTWLPLVHGQGPLTAENGFKDQAEVLIETRRAADLLGATPMDRPEDVEFNPKDGKLYVALTNNNKREADKVDAVNPRAKNVSGHILALIAPREDHTAAQYTWELPLLAGDPSKADSGARYPAGVTADGWFACPDNLAVDNGGRLWIATDQGENWSKTNNSDGMWACDTQGPAAYVPRFFFRCPIGAEMCGPEFSSDSKALFLAVQHPGSDGLPESSFDKPATRWPDFKDGMPPRPSVLAIVKDDGGVIGG